MPGNVEGIFRQRRRLRLVARCLTQAMEADSIRLWLTVAIVAVVWAKSRNSPRFQAGEQLGVILWTVAPKRECPVFRPHWQSPSPFRMWRDAGVVGDLLSVGAGATVGQLDFFFSRSGATMMSTTQAKSKSVAEKLMLAGGAATTALVSGTTADAGIVAAQNLPSVNWYSTSDQGWDIDGNGTEEFFAQARRYTSQYQTYYGQIITFSSARAAFDEKPGGWFVVPTYYPLGIQKLSSGVEVKATMAGLGFAADTQTGNSVTSYGAIAGRFANGGWSTLGTGFFGFKFTDGTDTFFGWGELNVPGGAGGGGFSVLRAYYNDAPGAAIKVGDTGAGGPVIPEPSTCALALLAAGGVAAYRARRKVTAA